MAFRHGKFAEITINSVALTSFGDNLEITLNGETADVTTFGSTWRSHIAGLLTGTMSLSGSYDGTATTGPASALVTVLTGLAPVAVVVKPGGTASTQRTHSGNALVTSYSESSPVDDKVTFAAELLFTGAVTSTTQ